MARAVWLVEAGWREEAIELAANIRERYSPSDAPHCGRAEQHNCMTEQLATS